MRMGFSYIEFKSQKCIICICVPLRAFLVYFMNRHQHNVTFKPSEKDVGNLKIQIKFKDTGFHLQ